MPGTVTCYIIGVKTLWLIWLIPSHEQLVGCHGTCCRVVHTPVEIVDERNAVRQKRKASVVFDASYRGRCSRLEKNYKIRVLARFELIL